MPETSGLVTGQPLASAPRAPSQLTVMRNPKSRSGRSSLLGWRCDRHRAAPGRRWDGTRSGPGFVGAGTGVPARIRRRPGSRSRARRRPSSLERWPARLLRPPAGRGESARSGYGCQPCTATPLTSPSDSCRPAREPAETRSSVERDEFRPLYVVRCGGRPGLGGVPPRRGLP
jgi:hypothetical protein